MAPHLCVRTCAAVLPRREFLSICPEVIFTSVFLRNSQNTATSAISSLKSTKDMWRCSIVCNLSWRPVEELINDRTTMCGTIDLRRSENGHRPPPPAAWVGACAPTRRWSSSGSSVHEDRGMRGGQTASGDSMATDAGAHCQGLHEESCALCAHGVTRFPTERSSILTSTVARVPRAPKT